MAGSSLIPGILDHIVEKGIIPLLPWHTRPLLMALSRSWRDALHAIGVQGGNRLDLIGELTAILTRLKQPLECRLAVDYRMYRHRENVRLRESCNMLKLFDGQWRNVAPISGRGPYTNSAEEQFLGVLDGRLYFRGRVPGPNPTIRIIALDVGSGLWQWKEVCRSENDLDLLLHICRSNRAAGNLYVYRICRRGCHVRSILDVTDYYLDITETPALEQMTGRARHVHFLSSMYTPQPLFVHVGNRLYYFGSAAVPYTEGVLFVHLITGAWHRSIVIAQFGGNLNVEKNVLLVGYYDRNFHILRYDSANARWIRAGWMLSPAHRDPVFLWTWCVEYDDESEKQLWIYIRSRREDEGFNLCKWQVVQRLREGRFIHKIWDDTVLPEGEVECELVNPTPLDQPIEPLKHICVSSLHGFHRSDSTNFEDIPRVDDSTNFEDILRVDVFN